MRETATKLAVDALVRTRLDHVPFEGFDSKARPNSEAEGYAIQDALAPELQLTSLGWRSGHKIGCTTKVMQDYLKIPNPCGGGVYEGTVQHEHGTFPLSDFVRVGVECEIAVRLAEDLPPRATAFTREDVACAVGACMVAIEIVDDRYADFTKLGAPTLIADDFFGAGCVLGPEIADFDPFELSQVSASMLIDGTSVGSGVGSDVLGNPLDALTWLANNAADRTINGLRAGEFVLLGSLVQTKWINGPCEVRAINDPLGEIVAVFT
ncbi:fumarylacetoacetate hydrolase family protein [Streptosporangium sp. NPDC023825]|uniref:2-keto-4-pentenoate hydratase n=1 Tax=Streptosporangium sp. NPDC023825 TaxID=3154909 RepID=UPI003446CC01